MAEEAARKPPAYVTYKSFFNYISGLRKNGMPTHLTRTTLPGSNSGKATMAASLKSLGLIGEDHAPTLLMEQLVDSDRDYSDVLKVVLKDNYPFLLNDDFDLANTTTEMVQEKFRAAGASGSTVTKGIAFFLGACKDANITVSKYVKPPKPAASTGKKRRRDSGGGSGSGEESSKNSHPKGENPNDSLFHNKVRIPVPLHGMDDGMILIPKGMNKDQWDYALKIATFLLENYRPDFADDDYDEEIED